MDAEQLKRFLKNHNLRPNFTYGQNFLIDDFVLQDIVDAAEVASEDAVLEIGPGIGNLTRLLCERAGLVLSLEKDPKFLPILKAIKKEYPDNFRYEICDALEYDFQDFFAGLQSSPPYKGGVPREAGGGGISRLSTTPSRQVGTPLLFQEGNTALVPYKVVANIPYFITGKILKMLMTAKFKPSSVTILTQKEVARNITAKAGDLSILAISVQLFGEPKIVQTVLAKSFYPAPKVDSAIVKIDLFKKPKYILADEKKFFKILKACFSGKRKQIHNTLVNNLGLEKEMVLKILSSLKIKPEARPQELSIEKWIELTVKITNIKLQISN
jgi:16S rRNA (adenine1518-N6/adenine1519-N6)-dimethyltransferase